jgi:ATP-dependent Zn protease
MELLPAMRGTKPPRSEPHIQLKHFSPHPPARKGPSHMDSTKNLSNCRLCLIKGQTQAKFSQLNAFSKTRVLPFFFFFFFFFVFHMRAAQKTGVQAFFFLVSQMRTARKKQAQPFFFFVSQMRTARKTCLPA